MENSISWSKLIESIEDPFSLDVAEEFIECILKKESSRKITLSSDILPLDDEKIDVLDTANHTRADLIRFIIDKIKNNINSSHVADSELFNESICNLTNEEILRLISFSDKDIEEIFINGKEFECSDGLKNVINSIQSMTNILGEHTGSSSIFKTKNPSEKTDTRIYLNTPINKNGFDFLSEFIKKCIDRGILHDMKGFDKMDSSNGKDRTVIYGHTGCFLDQIEMLEEIQKEHPDWVDDFGTPTHTGGSPQINGNKEWYSIGYTPANPKTGRTLMQTYNDFIDVSGLIGFGSAICQSISPKTVEELREQYNKIYKDNVGIKEWSDIISQMATLSSDKSGIVVGVNSFELNSGNIKMTEMNFAHFLVHESGTNFEECFEKVFAKDSAEREVFVKRFKKQTEKAVERALGKEVSPIYLSAKMCDMHSKERDSIDKTKGFRAPNEEDLIGVTDNKFRKSIDFDR